MYFDLFLNDFCNLCIAKLMDSSQDIVPVGKLLVFLRNSLYKLERSSSRYPYLKVCYFNSKPVKEAVVPVCIVVQSPVRPD